MSESIVTDTPPGGRKRDSASRWRQVGQLGYRVVGIVLGVVLCVTGWSHMQNEYFFFADVRQYGILGRSGSTIAMYLLPALHLTIGACLLADHLPRGATLLSCLLFGTYVTAQIWVWASGKVIDCGCFGVLHTEVIGPATIARTLIFLAAAVGIATCAFRQEGSEVNPISGHLS